MPQLPVYGLGRGEGPVKPLARCKWLISIEKPAFASRWRVVQNGGGLDGYRTARQAPDGSGMIWRESRPSNLNRTAALFPSTISSKIIS